VGSAKIVPVDYFYEIPGYDHQRRMHYLESRPEFQERNRDNEIRLTCDSLCRSIGVCDFDKRSGEIRGTSRRKVVADFAEAINRGDSKSFVALFTEDADFVVTTGKYLKGRNEIATILSYRIGMTRSCRN
jgi:SnoaL-like domain